MNHGGRLRNRRSGELRRQAAAALFVSQLLAVLPGCGLLKNLNAINPNAPSVTAQFAAAIALGTNLQRSSGEATLLRLQTLFPGVDPTTVNSMTGSAIFDPNAYNSLTATGLNLPIASMLRPIDPLGMMALRASVATLCQMYSPTSNAANSIYDTGVLQGSTPSDPSVAFALTVARNVWLDIYQATDPEVVRLAQLYQTALTASSNSVPAAQEAVCEAAISAPQFWIGNATQSDALRRAALEIGRQIPSMSDLQSYASGTLSIRDYVSQIQQSPAKQPGYIAAVNNWLQDWLGLRGTLTPASSLFGFANPYSLDQIRAAPFMPAQFTGPSLLGPAGITLSTIAGTNSALTAIAASASVGVTNYIHVNWSAIDFQITGGWLPIAENSQISNPPIQPNDPRITNVLGTSGIQTFDPRTSMILWEHRSPSGTGPWVSVGAWVHNDSNSIAQYNQVMGLAAGTVPNCPLITTTNPADPNAVYAGNQTAPYRGNLSNWYECGGTLTDGTPTTLERTHACALHRYSNRLFRGLQPVHLQRLRYPD